MRPVGRNSPKSRPLVHPAKLPSPLPTPSPHPREPKVFLEGGGAGLLSPRAAPQYARIVTPVKVSSTIRLISVQQNCPGLLDGGIQELIWFFYPPCPRDVITHLVLQTYEVRAP